MQSNPFAVDILQSVNLQIYQDFVSKITAVEIFLIYIKIIDMDL